MRQFVPLVSPDDHIVEPAHLWQTYVPEKFRSLAPRTERRHGRVALSGGTFEYREDPEEPAADVWIFNDQVTPIPRSAAAVGLPLIKMDSDPTTFEEMRTGCYEPTARLADMDEAGIAASVCFPNTFVQFCGQRFLHVKDRDLGLACVVAYNDFVIEEWCADSDGRLVPLCIVPMWDAQLAASEVRRNAARGARAVCFSELPSYLRLPSIHSGEWDPFIAACEETGTVIMMHIGSGSRLPNSSKDAPAALASTASSMNSGLALLDWLYSGKLIEYPGVRLCFAEAQAGWIPYYLERADTVWEHNRGWNEIYPKIPEPPSSYYERSVFTTVFSDDFALANLDIIGSGNVMFESDYPHSDSNWPVSKDTAARMTAHLGEADAYKVIAGNAIDLFRIDLPAEWDSSTFGRR